MNRKKLSRFPLALTLGTLLLSGCSGLLLGDENLSDPVDLPSNPNLVQLNQVWQASIGDGTDERSLKLRPSVGRNGIVAVSADGQISAFSTAGEQLWTRTAGHSIAAGVAGNDSIVVVGSENGLLLAYTKADGRPKWMYQLTSEILAVPTLSNGLVIARTIDGQITAISEKKGNVVWKNNVGTAELSIRGNADGVLLDNVILFTNDKGHIILLALENGQVIKDMAVSRGRGVTAIERVADLVATPVVRDGVVFLSAYRHETLAINLRNGKLLWKADIASALDLFADDRYVYIADKNSIIHAVDRTTGKTAWSSRAVEGHRISPLAGNGKDVALVDNEGRLIILDSNNGKILSYKEVGDERTYVAPQWVDGQWLTYTGDGELTLTTTTQTQ